MEAYNGTGNPRDHVIDYKTFMELQTHFDVLLYKVFPTTLTGTTLTWFNNLEVESIRTFGDLANSFMGRFIASILALQKTSYLEIVRQKRDESLQE